MPPPSPEKMKRKSPLSFFRRRKGKKVDNTPNSGPSTSLPIVTPPGVVLANSSPVDVPAITDTTPKALPVLLRAEVPSSESTPSVSSPSGPVTLGTSGLFQFPPREGPAAAYTDSLAAEVPAELNFVDIIAVHGLGGHWMTTWRAEDGAIWLRDRIPTLLSTHGISCRVRSFGYDSAMVITNANTDIPGCATDLLNRINVMRSSEADKGRPIIFVAHSLGGLVVKAAISIAWASDRWYSDTSTSVKGCIFMGVPHRGADIARLGKYGTSMLSLLSMGLAGNSNFLSSLERSSKDWHRISRDFVEPGERLLIKSFYETLKTGNMIVVDEASATLNHSNEQTFPLHKNHRAICRFKDTEDNVFDLVGHAVLDVVKSQRSSTPDDTPHHLMSDIPPTTNTFFGRKDELGILRDTLDPSKPLMKGVVISGISGSGKTQLALQHIQEYEDRYTAIIWINASSKGDIETSSAAALEYLKTFWPNDRSTPTFPGQPPATSLIVRLRSTIHTKWLLVLDSADDPDALDFAKHLQLCKHGSVIVTSTRRSSADVFEKMSFEQQEIDSLDSSDGIRLLLSISNHTARAQGDEHTESDERRALPIVRELYGIPLALEQAGVLLRKRIVSLDTFIEQYRKQYHLLMTQQPTRGLISYEKNERSVVAILSMIYSSIKEESPPAAALLTCLGMLGPRKISSDVLRGFGSAWVKEKGGSYESTLGECLMNETQFRISIAYLLDICLVRRYDDSRNLQEHISVHGIICKWIVEMVLPQQTSDIPRIVEGVARVVRSDDGRCMTIMDSLVPEDAERESPGVFNMISMHLGYIFLSQSKYGDAISKFNSCIATERSQDLENWPSTERALELLFGLAVALQKSGDLSQSRQTLASILPLAERLFGNFDDRVAEISSRLKAVSDHEETNLQHHKRVVVGSTAKSDRAFGTSARAGEDQNEGGSWAAGSGNEEVAGSPSDSGSYVESESDSDETRLQRAIETGDEALVRRLIESGSDVEWRDAFDRTLLSQAAAAGQEAIVKLLLATGNVDIESRDSNGLTPLSRAASFGHGAVVQLLLATGNVDIESRDLGGWTPLSWAAVNGHEPTIRLLVATGKVDVDSRDNNGRTPLSWAAVNGHEGIVRFLLGTGKVDVESADRDGRTPLDWATMYGRDGVIELLTLAK